MPKAADALQICKPIAEPAGFPPLQARGVIAFIGLGFTGAVMAGLLFQLLV